MRRNKNDKKNGQIHPDQLEQKENQNGSSSGLDSAASQSKYFTLSWLLVNSLNKYLRCSSSVNVAVPDNDHKKKKEEKEKPQLVSFMGLVRYRTDELISTDTIIGFSSFVLHMGWTLFTC